MRTGFEGHFEACIWAQSICNCRWCVIFCLMALLLLLLLLQAESSELEGRAAAGRQELTALRAEVGAAVAVSWFSQQ
jgi:hypothetical protein